MPILFQMFCLCFVFLFIWLSVLGFKASKVRWTKVTGVPRTTSSVVYFSSGKKIKIWVVGQKSRGEYAWKAADRNCPCKVVVLKNKVKCLPTVTVLLLASIPPEGGHNYSNARGRKRGLGLLFPFGARSFCSQLHVYAKRTVEEMDIFSLFETNNFSLLMSNSFLTALPYINPLHTSKN